MANSKVAKGSRPGIFGFYKRKILFFGLIFLALFGIYSWVSNNSYKADTSPIITGNSNNKNYNLEILPNGRLMMDGRDSGKRVAIIDAGDELRLPVVDQAGISMSNVKIVLTLPGNLANQTKHEILTIHGVGSSSSYVSDSKTIVYEADDVSGYATISIVALLPKGTIKPTLTQEIQSKVSGVNIDYWLISAIVLPLLTFLFMVFFLLVQTRRQKIEIPTQPIGAPPMAIPPALVGVLVHQKVRSREIAAALIDLAIRGDIVIIDRERGFSFGKGKFDKRLLGYEKILLSKIFRNNLSADRIEIEQRINNHFYSKKISLVSAGIYALTTRLGYFKTNPQSVHAKYRLFGILTFLVGLAGFGASFIYFSSPPYIVFFWVGMMISAAVIAVSDSYIPIRTPLGQEELSNWLAFKKYLSSPEPISFSPNLHNIFLNYLPYAIVMDCEAAWAKRFTDHNFATPVWFLTERGGLALEDFCLSLFPIISYVSRSFVALREPGFE